jgi:hypothetical protein
MGAVLAAWLPFAAAGPSTPTRVVYDARVAIVRAS